MGRPHATAGSSAIEPQPNDAAVLCYCDSGYTGHDCSQQVETETQTETQTQTEESVPVASVTCPDGVSTCPAGTSCAPMSTAYYGCCATPDAVRAPLKQSLCLDTHLDAAMVQRDLFAGQVICDAAFCCPKGSVCGEVNERGNSMGCVATASEASLL